MKESKKIRKSNTALEQRWLRVREDFFLLFTQNIYIFPAGLTLDCRAAAVFPAYCWLQFRYLCVCVCVCMCVFVYVCVVSSGGLGKASRRINFQQLPVQMLWITCSHIPSFVFPVLRVCTSRRRQRKRQQAAACLQYIHIVVFHPRILYITTTLIARGWNVKNWKKIQGLVSFVEPRCWWLSVSLRFDVRSCPKAASNRLDCISAKKRFPFFTFLFFFFFLLMQLCL